MAVYVCRRCGHEQVEAWLEECPSCRGFYRPRKIGVDTADQKRRSTFAAAAEFKRSYIKTGVEGFDHAVGGGLVAGCTILLGGFRGVGKSTLLCMVCDAVATAQGGATYASSEEGTDGVVAIAHRLGIMNEKVDVLGNQVSIEDTIDEVRRTKPFLTIYDSLQKFMSNTSSGAPGSIAQEKAVTAAIRDYHVPTKTCAIVINQMDKSGEMKGSTDAAHAHDTVLVFAFPRDNDEDAPTEEGIRVLAVDGKNRNGSENAKTYWRMTERGLLERVPQRSLIAVPTRKYSRREN